VKSRCVGPKGIDRLPQPAGQPISRTLLLPCSIRSRLSRGVLLIGQILTLLPLYHRYDYEKEVLCSYSGALGEPAGIPICVSAALVSPLKLGPEPLPSSSTLQDRMEVLELYPLPASSSKHNKTPSFAPGSSVSSKSSLLSKSRGPPFISSPDSISSVSMLVGSAL
jgi:hypothetical protein